VTKLLDARTSQNASYANSIAILNTVANTPQLVGQLGLIVTGAGPLLRVQMNGTVSVQLPAIPVLTTFTITIVRGTLPTDPLVYSASEEVGVAILGPQVLTATASDYNVPIPVSGQLVYTMFVSSNTVGTLRVGPESLNGAAYSD
jgi:hypothetical protein